jgi:hypothetical protein
MLTYTSLSQQQYGNGKRDVAYGKRDVAYGICLRYALAAMPRQARLDAPEVLHHGKESGTLHTGSACGILLLPCRAKPGSMRRGSSTT